MSAPRAALRTPALYVAGLIVGAGLLSACAADEATETRAPSPSGAAVTAEPAGAVPSDSVTAPTEPAQEPKPQAAPPVEQTAVSPPGGAGNLEPVPTVAVTTLPPVALDQTSAVSDAVVIRLAGLEAVQVTGRGPGQLSGPGLAVTVEVDNDGGNDLDVAGLAVSLAYDDTEAGPVDGPPAAPVTGAVAAGTTVTGTYVFLVPEQGRAEVVVRVGLASQPVAVFTGNATT